MENVSWFYSGFLIPFFSVVLDRQLRQFSKNQIIEHFTVQFSRTLADYQRLDDMVEALEASLNLRL